MSKEVLFENIDDHVSHFSELVQMEREEEMRRHKDEIDRLSGRERERVGRAVLDMRGRDSGLGLGGRFLVKLVKRGPGSSSVPLPDLDMGNGDLVLVSKGEPRDDDPTGTIVDKTGRSLTVAFDRRPPLFVYKRGVRVDLFVNDITYQRMLEALSRLPKNEGWSRFLLGKDDIPGGRPSRHPELHNTDLNQSQVAAISAALGPSKAHLIHGPPGTGKTVACIEIIEQHVDKGDKVLATADSNVAVDNMLEMLINRGRKALRVGHPARVTPSLRERTLDHIIQDHPAFKECQAIREEAFALKEVQDRYTLPSGRWRRGLANEEILHLAEKGRGTRGIPADKITSMAKWIRKREELDDMFAKADRLQHEAVADIIEKADVVCTTNSTAGSEMLSEVKFDTGVIDEATQAVEPACLIPLLKVGRAVLAGDHKQLPPTVLNLDAERKGLSWTMFERLLQLYGDCIKSLLEVQYRMHRDIMDFPNREFYDGKVHAHRSVEAHTLADIDGYYPSRGPRSGDISMVLDPSVPLVFVDIGGRKGEKTPTGSTSKRNKGEAKLVTDIVNSFLGAGLKPKHMAVITPYDAQVGLLRSMLAGKEYDHLEIGSVDGFQGREKEVVILSLVRSNDRGDLGFLTDLRRLNVSITRAKRKLVVVGDASTITRDSTYARMVDNFKERGRSLDA